MGAGSWVMAVAASVAQSDPKKLKEIMKQVPVSLERSSWCRP